MAKKRRTTFLKTQKERARLEKQAEKRARRQNRETDVPGRSVLRRAAAAHRDAARGGAASRLRSPAVERSLPPTTLL